MSAFALHFQHLTQDNTNFNAWKPIFDAFTNIGSYMSAHIL